MAVIDEGSPTLDRRRFGVPWLNRTFLPALLLAMFFATSPV